MFATFVELILSICPLCLVSGERPSCKGSALDPDKFSKPKDVGLVRDVIVDIIARNLNNKLNHPVSNYCEDLANFRTSTCFPICIKWKRPGCWNKKATAQVMEMAEKLVDYYNNVVSKEKALANTADEKFIFDRINEGKHRLIDAGVADDHFIWTLEQLKKNFCTRYHLEEQQLIYQDSIGRNDDETMGKLGDLINDNDLIDAVNLFIRNYEAEDALISKYHLETDIVEAGDNMPSGILRLAFEYKSKNSDKFKNSAVILKVPSLSSLPYTELKKTNMFDREVYFYKTLLPTLYQMGSFEPFAPKLYAATAATALVLEDLSIEGYKPGNRALQLDINHSKLALEVLANYHALSYIYLLSPNQYHPDMSLLGSLQLILMGGPEKDTFDKFCRMMKSEVTSPLYNDIMKLENEILTDPMTKKSRSGFIFTVIAHADFQTKNILFKYDDGGLVCKAKVINWQLSRQASPVLDLIYFFVTSVPIEIFEIHYNTLVNFYVEKLNSQLSALKSIRFYERSELVEDMAYYKHYYMKVLCIIWQQIMCAGPPSQDTDRYWLKARKWLYFLERSGGLYDDFF